MRLSMLYDVSGVLGALSMLPRVWKRRELRLRPAWRARPTSWTALRKIAASAHGPAQMHGQDSGALLSHTAETTFEQLEEVLAEELGFDSSNLLHRLCGPPSIPCCSWRWWQVEQLLVEQDEAELLARLSSSLLSSSSASRSSWRRSWPGCAGWSRRTSSVSRGRGSGLILDALLRSCSSSSMRFEGRSPHTAGGRAVHAELAGLTGWRSRWAEGCRRGRRTGEGWGRG